MPDSEIAPIKASVRILELSAEDNSKFFRADDEESASETDTVGEEQATRNAANAKTGMMRNMKEK